MDVMDVEVATGGDGISKTCPNWGQEGKQPELGEEKELR